MNALINRLISEATAPIGKMSARLFKKAVLFFVAMSCLFVSSIFLTIALFVFVQPLAGTAMAALATGTLYLGVALICIIVASRDRAGQATPAAAEPYQMTDAKGSSPSQKLALANTIDDAVMPILDILHEAGLERERLALAAGAEIAKQLHPFSLAAFAIVAGFILGRILKQRTSSPK